MNIQKMISAILVFVFSSGLFAQKNNSRMSELEQSLRKLSMAQLAIESFYVDSVDSKKLTEDAINGMLSKLDPHSSYTNAEETKKLNEPLIGNFEGIGIQFNILEDTLLVIQPLTNGPSEKAGIMAGDRIIEVNDTAIAGVKMSREEIVRRLRGPRNSKVKLKIHRPGIKTPLSFNIVRDKIPVNTLDASYMINDSIGFIRLGSFGRTSHDEVKEAIEKLQKEGMKHLILDLQQNGGGYLDAATNIANEFLQENELIVYTQGREAPYQAYKAKGNGCFKTGKIVVLVDEYSASASEIVTGAIQDHDRGLVVGRRTFGKGLVQRPFNLPDGSMIRLTIARYYTPCGRCIQKPYTKGDKLGYNMDVIERYNKGELTNEDSIHFPDSLQYKTLKLKRTVYGGGGVMPDYFIPLDTTKYTKLHRELTAKGCIMTTHLKSIDKNRKTWQNKYKNFNDFLSDFTIPQSVIDLLLEEGKKSDIKPENDEELEKALPEIKLQLKALIARDLWDMSEYFHVINTDNEMVNKAIELLQKEKTFGK